jgi:hypothetical protein
LVYLLPYFCHILLLLFGLLVPRFSPCSVYTLWFTSSQISAIFCLCSLENSQNLGASKPKNINRI